MQAEREAARGGSQGGQALGQGQAQRVCPAHGWPTHRQGLGTTNEAAGPLGGG